jgi:hypothetical protein
MARFLCFNCEEVVNAGSARFAFCGGCGAPLTIENLVPIQLIRAQPDQASRGGTPPPRDAPALAVTTSTMARISRTTSPSPSTT